MLDHFLQKNLCKCYYTIVRLAELNYTFDYTKNTSKPDYGNTPRSTCSSINFSQENAAELFLA